MEAAVPGAVFDGGVTARPRAAVGRPPRFDVLIAGGGLLGGLLLWTLDLHGGPPRLGLPAALTLVSLTTMSAAVAGEPARMARELHDMVANHLSAIAIHSTAAQSIDDPAATREALGVIRENSVQGLAEMRLLIGLLRGPRTAEGGAEPAATPTLDGLEALIEQARTSGRSSGPAFVLDDARSPAGPGTGPHRAAPAEPAAYRTVQESLTNALKHAAPGEVLVRLAQDRGGALTVAVRSPFADRPGPRAPGTGTGLVGMRERAALLGGAFEAGPESGPAGRVWLVRAALPAAGEEARR